MADPLHTRSAAMVRLSLDHWAALAAMLFIILIVAGLLPGSR